MSEATKPTEWAMKRAEDVIEHCLGDRTKKPDIAYEMALAIDEARAEWGGPELVEFAERSAAPNECHCRNGYQCIACYAKANTH